MGKVELSNGKVNGNEFSFDLDMRGNPMPHTGKLDGEVIKLKVEMGDAPKDRPGPGPDFGEMTLKKVE